MGDMADHAISTILDADDEYLHSLEYLGRGEYPPGIDHPDDLPSNPFTHFMPVEQLKPGKKPVKKPKKPTPSPPEKSEGSLPGFCGLRPFGILGYGPSGVGKSSFGAEFPHVGFVIDPQEDGIRDLVRTKQCKAPKFIEEVTSFDGGSNSLLDTCERIAGGEFEAQTVIFDSATGFERLCFEYHCEEYFEGDWSKHGFYNFQQGPKNAAKKDWPRFLAALDMIRNSGINVMLIAHAQVKTYENPEGPNYDRFIPYLDKETWQQTHRWASAVLFYNFHVELEKTGTKHKAKEGEDQRFIYCTRTPAFDAKNRYGLPPLIDAGDSGKTAYQAFKTEMLKAAQR